ncbi:rCG28880 [Rattus norvegicus]|uniref:RCG28880 n=1 Tax=Rattus norvegicus TaxID=10116 RepID=A6HV05_RAT|nr:rCG28880 [Rattus norvegicus]
MSHKACTQLGHLLPLSLCPGSGLFSFHLCTKHLKDSWPSFLITLL